MTCTHTHKHTPRLKHRRSSHLERRWGSPLCKTGRRSRPRVSPSALGGDTWCGKPASRCRSTAGPRRASKPRRDRCGPEAESRPGRSASGTSRKARRNSGRDRVSSGQTHSFSESMRHKQTLGGLTSRPVCLRRLHVLPRATRELRWMPGGRGRMKVARCPRHRRTKTAAGIYAIHAGNPSSAAKSP